MRPNQYLRLAATLARRRAEAVIIGLRQRKVEAVLEEEPIAEEPSEAQQWAECLHLSQLNLLSVSYMLLTVLEDPQAVTEEMRDQVLDMIIELQYGIARFEEFLV